MENSPFLTYKGSERDSSQENFQINDFSDIVNPYLYRSNEVQADKQEAVEEALPVDDEGEKEATQPVLPTPTSTPTPPSSSTSNLVRNRTVIGGDKKSFIETFGPYAERIAKETGMDKKFILAQVALETGWGKYTNSYNFGNIIAQKGYTGAYVERGDKDVQGNTKTQKFRKYNNLDEATTDYISTMKGKRYKGLAGLSAEQAAVAIGTTGYAEDPNYSSKILNIIKGL